MENTDNKEQLEPERIKSFIQDALDADKAEDIVTIELKGQTSIADCMIIATGTSSRQVGGMAEKLRERLKSLGMEYVRVEGLDQCNWVIVDAGDILVHLFRPEVREFYNLEKMWQSNPDMIRHPESASTI